MSNFNYSKFSGSREYFWEDFVTLIYTHDLGRSGKSFGE